MHDAVHRNNVNRGESSEATHFPLLISAIDEVRYTWMCTCDGRRSDDDDSWIEAEKSQRSMDSYDMASGHGEWPHHATDFINGSMGDHHVFLY
jgi:hypothetical protein